MKGFFKIKIVKIPKGPAPEEIRKQWVGLEIDHAKYLVSDEVNFLTGRKAPRRMAICVPKLTALSALAKKSRQGAKWFRENMPSGMNFLTFGEDEIEIIKTE